MAISNSLARDTCQQWKLESAEAVFETNTLATATSIELPAAEPLLHFSRRLDVVAWTLDRIQSSRLSK